MNFHSLNVNSASSPLFCFCIFLDRQNQWDVALCLVTRSGACKIYVNIFFSTFNYKNRVCVTFESTLEMGKYC